MLNGCPLLINAAVFGSISSLPPLARGGGIFVCESDGKADLLSDHVDSKQSRESFDSSLVCRPSHGFNTSAFRSSLVRSLWLDLHPDGVTNTLDMFPLFPAETC